MMYTDGWVHLGAVRACHTQVEEAGFIEMRKIAAAVHVNMHG
jgi:hypothetical protein